MGRNVDLFLLEHAKLLEVMVLHTSAKRGIYPRPGLDTYRGKTTWK